MKDKVVIITGASSGIGRSLAEVFGMNGSKVVLAARNYKNLEEFSMCLSSKGIKSLAVQCDVSNESDCKHLVEKTVEAFGTVDVMINNAGISMRALFNDVEMEVIRKIFDTNFWGTVYCTKYALPYLIKSKGVLVGVSSIAGKKGLPGRSGYSASKFAIEGFLETIRTENLKTGMHVLVACPGFTASNIRNTALSKDGRIQGDSPRNEKQMMKPDKVAYAIYKAVLRRKRDLILTGNGRFTVWANKIIPAFMDKIVYRHLAKEPNSPFK